MSKAEEGISEIQRSGHQNTRHEKLNEIVKMSKENNFSYKVIENVQENHKKRQIADRQTDTESQQRVERTLRRDRQLPTSRSDLESKIQKNGKNCRQRSVII